MRLHAIYKIVFVGFLSTFTVGCAETRIFPTPRNSNETENAAEPSGSQTAAPETTPTPLPPNVRKDADGNLIKPDGWPIQQIIPQDTRQRVEKGKTRNGKSVIFNVLSITPQGRPVSEAVSPAEDFYEWRINHVRELSGRDRKIFCYEYAASLFTRNTNDNIGMTTATSYRLCDYDGDGKYEFNGQRATVTIPNWVKTLSGDANAVDNNANY